MEPSAVISLSGSENLETANLGDGNDEEASYPTRPKKRSRTSKVWRDFTIVNDIIARCNHCNKQLSAKGSSGTSHLKNHLKTACPVLKSQRERQVGGNGTPQSSLSSFNQETSRFDLANMIIKHNYPFSIVDHEYFEIFCNGLNSNFKLVSRNTIRNDVLEIHNQEKLKMCSYLETIPRKITITTDIWTSDYQNFAYICLTAHFIDENWHLKKKILNYKKIPYPHDGNSLFGFVQDLLLDWNIDRKLCAIVVDNATANDSMVRRLTAWLVESSCLSLKGDLFHIRCSAHILNLVVQDGLKVIAGTLNKIRESVKYLAKSPYAKQKFDLSLSQVKLQGMKKVPMDVPNRWNSTYLMLDAALSLKEAFVRLEVLHINYKHNPSIQEWEIGQVVRDCLEVFYDATLHFSGSNFPTSNVFFPDICEIRLHLTKWESSEFDCLRAMAIPMKKKFEKYWEECSLLLAVAVVLDPRFKMDLVEYYYTRIFDFDAERHIERVKTTFVELFNEYKTICAPNSNQSNVGSFGSGMMPNLSQVDKLSDFDNWRRLTRPSLRVSEKTELENYLDEPVFPRGENFNILNWWKMNKVKYPILAKMAGDVLATPATTVASESAFSVGGRVIDETRASFLPEIVEALVTTSDWIGSKKRKSNEESIGENINDAAASTRDASF